MTVLVTKLSITPTQPTSTIKPTNPEVIQPLSVGTIPAIISLIVIRSANGTLVGPSNYTFTSAKVTSKDNNVIRFS